MEKGKFVGGNDYIERVAAYIRVSTQEQKLNGMSLDAQEEILTNYAKTNNLKIVKFYKDEGVSGRKPIMKRPALAEMIEGAQKKEFDRIIFIKLDRFFRSVSEYHTCMRMIEPVLWTATEEKYDLTTANGRAFVNMKLTIAELEGDTAGERIDIVNEYKIREGLPLFGTNNMPMCYAVAEPEENERHKYIVKRNEEYMLDVIENIKVYRSLRGAVLYANNKHAVQFKYKAVRNALQNTMLYGRYRDNFNYCEPYITKEEFDDIQRVISNSPRETKANRVYLFSGLLTCPGCGRKLTGTQHYLPKKSGGYYEYNAYRCNASNIDKTCKFGTKLMERPIEKKLLDELQDIIGEKKAEAVKVSEKGEKVSKYNIKELKEELDRLNYSWQKNRIKDVKEYDRKYDALVAKIDKAESEAENEIVTDYSHIEEMLTSDWKKIYNALDPEHKRAFWRSFIEELTVLSYGRNKEIQKIIFF